MKPSWRRSSRPLAQPGNVWPRDSRRGSSPAAQPWVLAAKPNPDLMRASRRSAPARGAAEVARLKAQYGAATNQEALARYRSRLRRRDARSSTRPAARVTPPSFVDNPPMTLDDQLDFKVVSACGRYPARRLDVRQHDQRHHGHRAAARRRSGRIRLLYSCDPARAAHARRRHRERQAGVLRGDERAAAEGDSQPHARTSAPIRRPGASSWSCAAPGNDAAGIEARIDWMRLVALPSRLAAGEPAAHPRRRRPDAERPAPHDADGRRKLGAPVATAYWRQDNPLLLTATSFMTQTHHVYRLRWMLKDATPEAARGGHAS